MHYLFENYSESVGGGVIKNVAWSTMLSYVDCCHSGATKISSYTIIYLCHLFSSLESTNSRQIVLFLAWIQRARDHFFRISLGMTQHVRTHLVAAVSPQKRTRKGILVWFVIFYTTHLKLQMIIVNICFTVKNDAFQKIKNKLWLINIYKCIYL